MEDSMSERTQISVFLVNEPGELAKVCSILGEAEINIEAMSIQNAKDYVMELLRAREKSGRRVVLAQNYQGILKESSDFSIIRFLVDQPQKAEHLLAEAKYPVDTSQVLCVRLDNKPGQLGMVSRKLADANVNIDYVYGSVEASEGQTVFVMHVNDFENARKVLG